MQYESCPWTPLTLQDRIKSQTPTAPSPLRHSHLPEELEDKNIHAHPPPLLPAYFPKEDEYSKSRALAIADIAKLQHDKDKDEEEIKDASDPLPSPALVEKVYGPNTGSLTLEGIEALSRNPASFNVEEVEISEPSDIWSNMSIKSTPSQISNSSSGSMSRCSAEGEVNPFDDEHEQRHEKERERATEFCCWVCRHLEDRIKRMEDRLDQFARAFEQWS